jgi:hypothetical protein
MKKKMKPKTTKHKHSITGLLVAFGLIAFLAASAAEPPSNPSPAKPAQQEEVLTNPTIIELKELGLGESLIVEKIKTSRCNFDMSIAGLKQLKAAGVPETVIKEMLSAKSAAKGNERVVAASGSDPNDPASAHEAGIWWYEETNGKPKMTNLEPTVYTQNKTGVAFFERFGQTVKNHAVIRSPHAEIQIADRRPVFYFYFEKNGSGFIGISANEYVLAQFDVSEKDNQRRVVVGSANAYSGGESGAEGRSVRLFSYQKLGPGIYKVTPKEDLASGEYCFYYGGQTGGGRVFDFGVKGSPETEPVNQTIENKKSDSKTKGKNTKP